MMLELYGGGEAAIVSCHYVSTNFDPSRKNLHLEMRSDLGSQGEAKLQQKEKPGQFKLQDLVFLDSESIFVMPSAFNDDVQFGLQVSRPTNLYALKALQLREKVFQWIARAKTSQKQRLRERKEEYFQFEEPIARAEGGVSAACPGSVGWIPEAARFNTDPAGMLRQAQAKERQGMEDFYDARRDSSIRREEARWESMEEQERRNAEAEAHCAESRSRKNAGSAPFDMVTLQYHDTEAGKALAEADQGARSRQQARSKQMYDNANRSGFNPVTGGDNPYHSSNR